MHGPIIFDLLGPELTPEEKEIINHPLIGGIILFSRHYQSPEQITELCKAVRKSRPQPLLITVDHEGGRVQRFRERFTRLPPMGKIGELYNSTPQEAERVAEACGWLMAAELLAVGIDLSFAPVLDLDKKNNPVIGDRSFSATSAIVSLLAKKVIRGMRSAGMSAVGKHFPGHGSVTVDSHLGLPTDLRSWDEIASDDLLPFLDVIQDGINGIMPAHILFPAIDDRPVGFSARWLKNILRQQLNFKGMIISDDLNMKGADISGYAGRAQMALEAGCDAVLICNNRPAVIDMLDHLSHEKYQIENQKFLSLQGKFSHSLSTLISSSTWQENHKLVMNFSTQEIS